MTSFDSTRFARFLRFDLLSRRASQLLPLVVPPALFLLGALWSLMTGGNVTVWPSTSFSVALILAVEAAAQAHRRELDSGTAAFYMLLPVSHTERYLSRWILSFALPFVGQLILLTALANIVAGIGSIMGREWAGPILPSVPMLLGDLATFATVHSVFFAGGIFWRTNPVIKTIAATIGYGMVALMALAVAGAVSVKGGASSNFSWSNDGATEAFQALGDVGNLAWRVALPLLLYAAAFYRAKENEVRV